MSAPLFFRFFPLRSCTLFCLSKDKGTHLIEIRSFDVSTSLYIDLPSFCSVFCLLLFFSLHCLFSHAFLLSLLHFSSATVFCAFSTPPSFCLLLSLFLSLSLCCLCPHLFSATLRLANASFLVCVLLQPLALCVVSLSLWCFLFPPPYLTHLSVMVATLFFFSFHHTR